MGGGGGGPARGAGGGADGGGGNVWGAGPAGTRRQGGQQHRKRDSQEPSFHRMSRALLRVVRRRLAWNASSSHRLVRSTGRLSLPGDGIDASEPRFVANKQ